MPIYTSYGFNYDPIVPGGLFSESAIMFLSSYSQARQWEDLLQERQFLLS